METIAQISTPIGSGGIAIVRMSGEKAMEIAFNLFTAKNLTKEDIEPRKLYLGRFNLGDAFERCMLVYFKAPFSFTGEDVVEFQIHGGEFLATKILSKLLQSGVTMAQNGEFSKRAFINGKMSLDEAEAMIDMINATSDAEIKASSNLQSGNLCKTIVKIQGDIKESLIGLEVAIDYPEHDDESTTIKEVLNVLENSKKQIEKLVGTFESGHLVKYGIAVAIVGKPNVGKSSLLNSLLGEERAIVCDVKGTTRDTLKETLVYKGLKINFIDTAGIRESEDAVEKIGVGKSKQCIEKADIVLCVIDASNPLDNEDKELLDLVKDKETIYVLNKTDKQIITPFPNAIEISALKNENIDKIKDEILKRTRTNKIDFSQVVITNERHHEILKESLKCLDDAIQSAHNQTADIVDMEAKRVWKVLGKITGETETESIIDGIFAKFCLGK